MSIWSRNYYTSIIGEQYGGGLAGNGVWKIIIYKRNKRGPKIDPCGTPCFTFVHPETILVLSEESSI